MTAIVVLILRVALAAALYAFLGWALLILWRELKQQASFLASQKKPGISIQAMLENGRQIQHLFFQGEITIGRDPTCDFPIIDESISAHHARIAYHHAQWWLEDLNSTNGTYIGKSRLSVPTVLISTDKFRCGNTSFVVQMQPTDESLSAVIEQQNEA